MLWSLELAITVRCRSKAQAEPSTTTSQGRRRIRAACAPPSCRPLARVALRHRRPPASSCFHHGAVSPAVDDDVARAPPANSEVGPCGSAAIARGPSPPQVPPDRRAGLHGSLWYVDLMIAEGRCPRGDPAAFERRPSDAREPIGTILNAERSPKAGNRHEGRLGRRSAHAARLRSCGVEAHVSSANAVALPRCAFIPFGM